MKDFIWIVVLGYIYSNRLIGQDSYDLHTCPCSRQLLGFCLQSLRVFHLDDLSPREGYLFCFLLRGTDCLCLLSKVSTSPMRNSHSGVNQEPRTC